MWIQTFFLLGGGGGPQASECEKYEKNHVLDLIIMMLIVRINIHIKCCQ